MKVILRNNAFINNKESGLRILSADRAKISDCIFSKNEGNGAELFFAEKEIYHIRDYEISE